MLEFYFGSLAMLVFLRRKVGNAVAAFGVVSIFATSYGGSGSRGTGLARGLRGSPFPQA